MFVTNLCSINPDITVCGIKMWWIFGVYRKTAPEARLKVDCHPKPTPQSLHKLKKKMITFSLQNLREKNRRWKSVSSHIKLILYIYGRCVPFCIRDSHSLLMCGYCHNLKMLYTKTHFLDEKYKLCVHFLLAPKFGCRGGGGGQRICWDMF